MPKSKCPTKWKREYATKADAQKVADALNHKTPGKGAQKPYACPQGHWHVGSSRVYRHHQGRRR